MYIVEYMEHGKRHTGEFIGEEKEIRERLSKEGKVVLKAKKASALMSGVRKRASQGEVYAVLKSMGDLLSSGVPLIHAINTIVESLDKASMMRGVLLTIASALRQGKELSAAMMEYTHVFGMTTISMVRAGENSGKLAESLITAARYVKTLGSIKKEMVKKLSYPVTIFCIGVVALLFNTTVTIPKMMSSDLFKQFAGEDTTMIDTLRFISFAIPVMIAIAFVVAVIAVAMYKLHQEKVEKVFIRIPMLKEFIFYRGYYIVFFALSKLFEVGVQPQSALEIVKGSVTVVTIKHDIENAIKMLRSGENFARGFRNLTTIERTMLETANNQEKIKENLVSVSERFYEEYIERVQALAPRIYIFTLIFVAGIFLLMVLGIMIPYGKLLGGIK